MTWKDWPEGKLITALSGVLEAISVLGVTTWESAEGHLRIWGVPEMKEEKI